MDYLTWFLSLAVIAYAGILTYNTGVPLLRYKKAKDRVVRVNGIITSFYGEDVAKRKGEVLSSFYPVFCCDIEGNKRLLNGLVRYIGKGPEAAGQDVVLLYDKETDELWCEKDLPLMAKQIKVRLVTVAVVLALTILSSVML